MEHTMIYHFEYEQRFNIAEMELEPIEAVRSRFSEQSTVRAAYSSSLRVTRAGEVLQPDGYLGLQIIPTAAEEARVSVFFDTAQQVTDEDMRWMFQGCASIGTFRQNTLCSGDGSAHRIYALQYAAETCGGKSDEEEYYGKRHGFEYLSDAYKDALAALAEAGATLRFFTDGKRDGKGVILICLPDAMGLRLRTIIAQAFPQTQAVEITEQAEFERLPLSCLQEGMLGILLILVREKIQKADKLARETAPDSSEGNPEMQEDFLDQLDDDEPSTPLEDLQLSERTYNALKRAMINTVERLREMTDEELFKVRNLGMKSLREIRQKLKEFDHPGEPEASSEPEVSAEPEPPAGPSSAEMLAELIGLQNVKEQVRKIEAFARMKREMEARGMEVPVVLNMEFVGNPGTAKTTVARIVGGMLHDIGLLKSGDMVEVGRADLVARYVGQTADQVKTVFKRAKGKLLFIDEAYSLLESCEGLYGDEAINTIVQEMENNRKDTVVIFAGYPREMKAFFERNPGLRSRVPFRVCFSDYSAEEMLEIAALEATKRGFSIEPEAREKIVAICAAAAQKPGAGNGRFCRNLVENAILNYAARAYGGENADEAQAFVLTGEDFAAPDDPEKDKEIVRRPIGFCA